MTRIAPPTDELLTLPALELGRRIAAGDVTSAAVTQACLGRIAAVEPELNAMLHVAADAALAQAATVDAAVAAGEPLASPLAGVPIVIKDLLTTADMPTTAGSKILAGWQPPYDATVVAKVRAAQLVILGKANMDEFAMGSSGEWSAYGPTRNPWDTTRSPGGSSSGSAAAVAAYYAPLALGSDTGGSIRQPAGFSGVVGVKPTYGGVSRYGAIAMASSLDQIGPMGRTPADCAALHEIISGHDGVDSTSLEHEWTGLVTAAQGDGTGSPDLGGLRVGVVSELVSTPGSDECVQTRFAEAREMLVKLGADVKDVSCPSFAHALAAYYVIMPSEASSNLARYDAMRYGARVEPSDAPADGASAAAVMAATRAAGFGPEVKRRIILGTYALSAGYYDAYYGTAQRVRTLVQREFAAAFGQVDVLVSPSAVSTAFEIGSRVADPVQMYADDLTTIPANLAGIPGGSVPIGCSEAGLPVGLQVLAPAMEDQRVYRVMGALHSALA